MAKRDRRRARRERGRRVRRQRVLRPEEVSIVRETDYIVQRAEAHDSRMVRLGALLLFSTETGDAWALDPEDGLALCLAQDGVRQCYTVRDAATNFEVAWKAHYEIDGGAFVATTP